MKPTSNNEIRLTRPKFHWTFGGRWSFLLSFGLLSFLLYVFICVAPVITSIGYSFFDVSTGNLAGKEFVGYANYFAILSDREFWMSFRNDCLIVFGKLVIIVSLTILFGVGMTKLGLNKHEVGVYRFLLYLPQILSVVVITYFFQSFFDGNNGFLALITGQSNSLITKQPILLVTLMASWCGIGYFMIVLMSAIGNIPESLYEASRLDGASPAVQLFRITLPEVKDQIIFMVVNIISSSFAGNMNLTLPFFASRNENNMVMGTYIYHYSNDFNELGYSNAAAVLLMIVSFVVCYNLNKRLTKGEN